jgi:DNA-binding response OmpR family regulator
MQPHRHRHQAGDHDPRGRILLVEADPDAALFVTFVLRRGSFEVTHTADPAVALALAAAEPWDLVLAAADLPVLSGIELLAALRKLIPDLPVAILAACALDASSTAAASSYRPDAVLAQPIKAATLLAAVNALAAPDRAGNSRSSLPASGDSPPPGL